MSEFSIPTHVENTQKIPPGSTLLFAEPIFKTPSTQQVDRNKLRVPKGMESWASALHRRNFSDDEEARILAAEWFAIASALKRNDTPFRIIVAHRGDIDQPLLTAMMLRLNTRGLALHPSISSTCFPRDMMVNFGDLTFTNPEANLELPDKSDIPSPLGDGGAVIPLADKVFVADPAAYPPRQAALLRRDLERIENSFQIGFLPHPIAVKMDFSTNQTSEFITCHPDRVSGKLIGRDGRNYFLADSAYTEQYCYPWGSYYHTIRDACRQLQTELVLVKREDGDTPYSLNFEQFADGSVVMTSGHPQLEETVKQIVGEDKVVTTEIPIFIYPIRRRGGIRCMMLFAPRKIVGPAILDSKLLYTPGV